MLARAGLPVAAFAGELVDVVHRAEPDHRRIHHIVDERLGVLAGFALIAVDLVDREVLIAEWVIRVLAVPIDQPGHHLDQRRLAGAGLAVTHEGENEPAELRKWVQPALEIICHQHFRQLHRLILGDVVADDFVRHLEAHHERGRLAAPRGGKARDREFVRLDLPVGRGKGLQPGRGAGAQGDLFHQLFGEGQNGGDGARLITGVFFQILIQLPQRPLKCQRGVVGQQFLDLADFHRNFGRVGRQQERCGIAKDVQRDQRFGGQQFRKLGLLPAASPPARLSRFSASSPVRSANCSDTAKAIASACRNPCKTPA